MHAPVTSVRHYPEVLHLYMHVGLVLKSGNGKTHVRFPVDDFPDVGRKHEPSQNVIICRSHPPEPSVPRAQ